MQINILGMVYTVESKNLVFEQNDCGSCSPDRLLICVDQSLPPDKYNRVLFHEIIHAAMSELGYKDDYADERLVDNLALALYQTLRDCGALDMGCDVLKRTPRVVNGAS